jgi:S1-C subfamily serine protease
VRPTRRRLPILALLLAGGIAAGAGAVAGLRTGAPGAPALRLLAQPARTLGGTVSPAAAVYRRVAPSVVLVGTQSAVLTPAGLAPRVGWGTGVIFDPRGYIVTNDHVVAGVQSLVVTLADGTRLEGQVVGGDAATDLAVVRVRAPRPLPAAVFGDSRDVQPGELAIAIGNPLGPRLAQSVTQGIVSAVRPMLYGLTPDAQRVTEMIQTDTAINPGSSGGPLLNAAGEVIGITSVKVAQAEPGLAASGLGFAIPSDTVRRVALDLVRYGRVRRAWLGVRLEVAPADALPAEPQTVTVASVVPGGPAAAAGVRAGDRLVRWNGAAVANYYALVLRINAAEPGEQVRLVVGRDGRDVPLDVRLGDEPARGA